MATGPLDPALRAFQEKEKLVKDAQREELNIELMLNDIGWGHYQNEDVNLEENIAEYLANKYNKRIFKLMEKPWVKALR